APGRAAALERLLRARLGPVAAAPAIALVRGERPRLRAHFAGLRVKAVDGRPTTWLADPRLYATIRDLHRAGRVRALLGDLAGETSMRTIAAALTSLATPITVVYVSNAEESLLGRPSYRRNLEALPRVADAVLLRTIADDAWAPADGLWAYQAQPIAALLRRLAAAPELRLEDMLAEARRDGAASSGGSVGLTILDAPGAVASRRAR
ncbi:MAG: hypothetical protein KC636_26045, partial [Myxococcales bacterium]|nr:hypothetical protein [Myxococcales bacterium]